jgi:hypothetical protein
MAEVKKQKIVLVMSQSNFSDAPHTDVVAAIAGYLKRRYGDKVDVEVNLVESACWVAHKKSESAYTTSPARRLVELAADEGAIVSTVGYCGFARGMYEECYHPPLLYHENFRFYKKMADAVGAFTTGDKMLFF